MSRYDPFAYGEVRLAPNQKPAGDDPEDVLFADAEPVKQAPPADSSWALLQEDVDGLLPGGSAGAAPPAEEDAAAEFGAEILGEGPAPAAAAKPKRRPVTGVRTTEPTGDGSARVLPATQKRPEVRRKPRADAELPPVGEPRKPTRPRLAPGARRRPIAGTVVPMVVCAAGGSGAAWLYAMQDNPVMAGILGAATLVGALFAWLFLRG